MTNKNAERLWIVTGAEGFLGNNLVRELLRRGEQVRACVFESESPASLAGLPCDFVSLDVTKPESVNAAFTSSNDVEIIVVHCAGLVSIASKVTPMARQVNVTGTNVVISACEENRVDKLVYVSSVHAIPEPDSDVLIQEIDQATGFDPAQVVGEYAKTKTEATRSVLMANDLWRVVVHPSGMIGPGDYADSHLTRMVRDTVSGHLKAVVTGGYDFVDVRDVVNGIIAAATKGTNGRSYIFSGHFSKVADMVRTVAQAAGRTKALPTMPMWFAQLTAPLAELYYKIRGTKPLYTPYSLHTLRAPARFSNRRASAELGFSPRPLSDTLRDTVTWLRNSVVSSPA